jgi:tRNA pseudouridine38-40 synthase
MQQAARLLLGTHDFTSFATTDPDMSQRGGDLRERTDLSRSLFVSEVTREADLLLYRVTGSGFLHHMVRNVVGTLAEVGRGALSPAHIPIILARRDRAAAGPTAPPQGLFLVSVDYAAASSEAAALRQAAHA